MGCAGQASEASISIKPPTVDFEAKSIEVSGSGFTPGSKVTVGIPGLPINPDVPTAKDLWFASITVDQAGGFTTSVDLTRSLWRLKGATLTEDQIATAHTVLAKSDLGEEATTTLTVQKPQ